ncbi:hypothetical protein GGF32_003687 [Allomyces javanicus]|nr:hypothetical protein GGF32_003687 [Allomyces javanicus]
MVVSDLDMTVTFAGPIGYHVPFGTAHLPTGKGSKPSIYIPSRIAAPYGAVINVQWDLADDAQARALGVFGIDVATKERRVP